MFAIEMLPADNGDCIWIEYGKGRKRHHVIIDGGRVSTFPSLQDRLAGIGKINRHVDLLMVTHVDSDHIQGTIPLLQSKLNIEYGDIWFNGWKQLAHADELGPAEGEILSALIRKHKLPWNHAFAGNAVVTTDSGKLPRVSLEGGLDLTILSPLPQHLSSLRTVWKTEVRKAGLEPGHAGKALDLLEKRPRLHADALGERLPDIARLARSKFEDDTSRANGSSIAVLAEFDGLRCLLAADAFSGTLVSSVRRLLNETSVKRLALDAFKLSHHGSKGNTSPELLQLLDCKRYLVSTNGSQFEHPDRDAIARVIVDGGKSPELYFNYSTKYNHLWSDRRLIQKYGYQVHYPVNNDSGYRVEL